MKNRYKFKYVPYVTPLNSVPENIGEFFPHSNITKQRENGNGYL